MEPPAILFIPGFMCDARLFDAQMSALNSLGIKAKVGDLARADTIVAMADQVLWTAPPRFAIVGLSMGGIVALEIYRRAPHRITHLALLNTTPKADAAGSARKAQLRRIAEGDFEGVMRDEQKRPYLAQCNNNVDKRHLILDMARGLGPDAFVRQTNALMNRRTCEDMLHTIDCPTLVLTGEQDNICPAVVSGTMSEAIAGSQLRVLSDCGHLSTLEKPQAVSDAICELVTRRRVAPASASYVGASRTS